jgi:hypothetical protein
MTISTTCPGCGVTIAAPETAAGHKARCPHCGAVVPIPALAATIGGPTGGPDAASAAPAAPEEAPLHFLAETIEAPSSTPSRIGGHSSTMHAATTVDRLLARSSPYSRIRLLAAIHFGVGIVVAILLFLAGMVGMIFLSTSGTPVQGVLVFAGGLILAGLTLLGSITLSEMLRLWADVGDRARSSTALLEDFVNKK